MKENLSEEEMRHALFGTTITEVAPESHDLRIQSEQQQTSKARRAPTARSPKLRVTLSVTSQFEGKVETFIYEASTLSTLIAEQEAKAEAKKHKFRYFELVSIESI
ncbi:hypothetical protein [Pseudomonas rhodesiae]|uniref:Uncharacterized protein n=1 Tax=Pseudomonas rhodesiae TaxID=76760 RepID=A0AAE8HFI2_9PSED|nr:hypothetical protein [Pseudomonas rhodesiae]TWR54596.1 hypothetical protein FIV35_14870 [Pseudomonas rhodesiae]SDV13876.1 hypothetical protein SAMN04490209_4176 [Pseudomonas rhodesiae]